MSATMSRWRRALGGALLLIFVTGCDELGPGASEFTIAVDSVTGPLTIAPSMALTQFLYGPVGPDLCSSVKTLRVVRTETGADLTIVGVRHSGTCGQMPVYMSAHPATFSPPYPNRFVLRVRGRNGAWLARAILVQ